MAASLGWHALGEQNSQPTHYRKFKVYDLAETLAISECQFSGSSFGGPVACIAAAGGGRAAAAVPGGPSDPMELRMYSASGVVLGREPIRILSRVMGLGWSDLETFCCVHEDGTAVVYDLFGNAFPPFSLFESLPQVAVLPVVFFFFHSYFLSIFK